MQLSSFVYCKLSSWLVLGSRVQCGGGYSDLPLQLRYFIQQFRMVLVVYQLEVRVLQLVD